MQRTSSCKKTEGGGMRTGVRTQDRGEPRDEHSGEG